MNQFHNIREPLRKATGLLKVKIGEFMDLGDKENAVCRLYIAQSWVYELFEWLGILRAIGPMDTGKTTLIDGVLTPVAYLPFEVVGSESEPSMRRTMIRSHQAGMRTLICDDTAFDCSPGSERADNLINRCQRGGKASYLERDGDDWSHVVEEVFGPTILGCRNAFSDVAIESRCLDIPMGIQQRTKRKLRTTWDSSEGVIVDYFKEFRVEASKNLRPEKPEKPDSHIDDRAWDIGWPLVYLATLIDDNEGTDNLVTYLRDLSEDLVAAKTAEPAVLVLSAIIALSAESGPTGMTLPDPPKPVSLKALRDQIWSANRMTISEVQIGKILRQFGFKNKAHIYGSGGYTKLRGVNWQRLKEQAHRLGLYDELLESV